MMETEKIKDFFDKAAKTWDEELIFDPDIINIILDNASVSSGKDILDVACGTGVLIPFYLSRDVTGVTGVDLSEEMIKIASGKFSDERVSFICGDIEEVSLKKKFDCVVLYNAFPHFPDEKSLIKRLSSLLKEGGSLAIAHGMSREKINMHHDALARGVSKGLMEAEGLRELMSEYLSVKTCISDKKMYEVVGIKE